VEAPSLWELTFANDLVLIAESEKLLLEKLSKWKVNIEAKGMRVNMDKTKVMKCSVGGGRLVSFGKWPCRVCWKGVGRNSIACIVCKMWIHKKCSGIKGLLGMEQGLNVLYVWVKSIAGRNQKRRGDRAGPG
jgi:hypothetical protein